jgi:hypothetical protein
MEEIEEKYNTFTIDENGKVTIVDNRKKRLKKYPSATRLYLENMIGEGTYTAKEVLEAFAKELPNVKPQTVKSWVSQGKNPKYTDFDTIIIVDEDGILSFQK